MHSCVNGKSELGNQHTGCILADEMGLGKTIQSIALIYSIFMKDRTRKFIVVTPASLCRNWMKEFDKWLGEMERRGTKRLHSSFVVPMIEIYPDRMMYDMRPTLRR